MLPCDAAGWPAACQLDLYMQAIFHGNSMFESSQSIPNPAANLVGAIPDCTTNLFLTHDCLDFLYAPNSVPAVNVRTTISTTLSHLSSQMTTNQVRVCRCMCLGSNEYTERVTVACRT